mmetsp:Transcript_93441/g.269089  ORF Transcript_93441/g.269089 Transcript_93441/m.269089 type:complete len:215 (+) Transcript_93441:280-924(+)
MSARHSSTVLGTSSFRSLPEAFFFVSPSVSGLVVSSFSSVKAVSWSFLARSRARSRTPSMSSACAVSCNVVANASLLAERSSGTLLPSKSCMPASADLWPSLPFEAPLSSSAAPVACNFFARSAASLMMALTFFCSSVSSAAGGSTFVASALLDTFAAPSSSAAAPSTPSARSLAVLVSASPSRGASCPSSCVGMRSHWVPWSTPQVSKQAIQQ